MNSTETLRHAMVDQMVREGKITQPWVERAFRAVPRDQFLPDFPPEKVYTDEAIVTKWENGRPSSSSSQPSCMAEMLEKLDLDLGQKILEIGTGTGYNAALIALLVKSPSQVYSVDIDDDLVQKAQSTLEKVGLSGISLLCADGAFGYPEGAPFDRIIVTTAAEDVPFPWFQQLRDGGLLLLPFHLGSNPYQYLLKLQRSGNHLASVWIGQVGFIGMKGSACVREKMVALDDRLELIPDENTDRADLVIWMDTADSQRLDVIKKAIKGEEPRVARITNAPAHFFEWAGFRLYLFLECGQSMFVADSLKPVSRQFVGLVAPDGSCALLSNKVLAWGSNMALEILDSHVDHWDSLGRPVLPDFSLQFFPRELLDKDTFRLRDLKTGWLLPSRSHFICCSI